MVPASTIETYMMALRGLYCMAMVVWPSSMAASSRSSSCHEEYSRFAAGECVEAAALDPVYELAAARHRRE